MKIAIKTDKPCNEAGQKYEVITTHTIHNAIRKNQELLITELRGVAAHLTVAEMKPVQEKMQKDVAYDDRTKCRNS